MLIMTVSYVSLYKEAKFIESSKRDNWKSFIRVIKYFESSRAFFLGALYMPLGCTSPTISLCV